MAGVRKKGDAYYCTFRFQGQRYYFTIGQVSESHRASPSATTRLFVAFLTPSTGTEK
jgi:hypothetical protein